eukprot:TRINITY_DN3764_c0_g2_i2.p3 TRINITY_DN3764_c0_g2~~TRINITY_DN3764_c0_g2_i2.p3  ORF type:complete len:166 (+),score=3.88 TRINITY_DN3764_c0_g2_i2:1223-1720(+)
MAGALAMWVGGSAEDFLELLARKAVAGVLVVHREHVLSTGSIARRARRLSAMKLLCQRPLKEVLVAVVAEDQLRVCDAERVGDPQRCENGEISRPADRRSSSCLASRRPPGQKSVWRTRCSHITRQRAFPDVPGSEKWVTGILVCVIALGLWGCAESDTMLLLAK